VKVRLRKSHQSDSPLLQLISRQDSPLSHIGVALFVYKLTSLLSQEKILKKILSTSFVWGIHLVMIWNKSYFGAHFINLFSHMPYIRTFVLPWYINKKKSNNWKNMLKMLLWYYSNHKNRRHRCQDGSWTFYFLFCEKLSKFIIAVYMHRTHITSKNCIIYNTYRIARLTSSVIRGIWTLTYVQLYIDC